VPSDTVVAPAMVGMFPKVLVNATRFNINYVSAGSPQLAKTAFDPDKNLPFGLPRETNTLWTNILWNSA
jgi:hypothetical protein